MGLSEHVITLIEGYQRLNNRDNPLAIATGDDIDTDDASVSDAYFDSDTFDKHSDINGQRVDVELDI